MNSRTTQIAGMILCGFLLIPAWLRERTLARAATPGTVVATQNMTAIRFDHAAALLPNGEVLIVGGIARNGVMQSTAEIFDPATGRFSPTASPQSPRGWGVTATILRDGKVLVAGGSTGCDSPCYSASAELYDPATHKFIRTGNMTSPRAEARTVLLASGDVLLVGGTEVSNRTPFATAELYHSATGTFSPLGATHLPDPTRLLLLKNGNVLILGASGADFFDPRTERFTSTGSMINARGKFGAALLPDGRVLVVGGQTGGSWGEELDTTEIYDPAAGKFTPGPEMKFKRFKLTKAVVPLRDGRTLIAGGAEQPEVFDPASRTFFPVPGAKLDGFLFSTATVLKDGSVLICGGYSRPGGAGVNHAWLYKP